MKKMSLNQGTVIKTVLLVFTVALSVIATYAEQTAEEYAAAQTQNAATPWISGSDHIDTQKAMENSGIAAKQGQQVQMSPAIPMNQDEASSITPVQTPTIRTEDTEPKTQSTASTEESEKTGTTTMDWQNNIVYVGILVAVLLAVFVFMQSRKAKNKEKKG